LEALLDRVYTYALVMKNPEASGEHLLAMLALDEAGQREIVRGSFDPEAVFSASYIAVQSKPRLASDIAIGAVATSDALSAIMEEAGSTARGCEDTPRAIATCDVIDAIWSRQAGDPLKALLSGHRPKTAAEEVRDGVRAILDSLSTFAANVETTSRRTSDIENEVVIVRSVVSDIANDNNARWARAKTAAVAAAFLTVVAFGLLAVFGTEPIQIALNWLRFAA
jgi:hypothetical protein